VLSKGLTVRGPSFITKTILNKRIDNYRVAVVVSKKVNKSAVARNRIRRKLYEALRSIENQINDTYDIVIIVHSSNVQNLPFQTLLNQLKSQLKRAKII
jgi:ribonuclease P protein component